MDAGQEEEEEEEVVVVFTCEHRGGSAQQLEPRTKPRKLSCCFLLTSRALGSSKGQSSTWALVHTEIMRKRKTVDKYEKDGR